MRLVSIDHVKPQVYLAKTIYDSKGTVLLAKGTLLTVRYLERLKRLGIGSIYVDDGSTALVEIDEVVSEETRLRVLQTTREALLKVKAGKAPEAQKIRQAVDEIINEILRSKEIIINLTDIWSLKDHTFAHSVNVCILSLLIGLAVGYDQIQLKELGTGALLHDIGKAMIPEFIVNSTKVFTAEEYQIIQRHVEFGFEILRRTKNISFTTAQVAWQHHERYNGKGYPRKLKGNDILEFARVVAVADVYDALSADRPYRGRLLPHEVVEIIRGSQGVDFDPEIAKELIRSIAPFPVGSVVLLSTGFKGVIIGVKKDFPTRPLVQLIYDNNGRRLEGCQVVDLMRELTVFVVNVIKG